MLQLKLHANMSYKDKNFISVAEAAEIMSISRIHIITDKERLRVDKAVEKVLGDYGDVIKKLGAE